MPRYVLSCLLVLSFSSCAQRTPVPDTPTSSNPPIALAIHGGAGTLSPDDLDDDTRAAYEESLAKALDAGYSVLAGGGDALDAVTGAIVLLENSELFNAGVGAVYTYEAVHELDASLMVGEQRQAGAVAGVQRVRNPILAAQAVMQHSPHVLLSGPGADQFAAGRGLAMVENTHFDTPRRLRALERAKEKLAAEAPEKWGTVGAVALDRNGTIVAGTSTGGMTAKRWGRIGDSPLIGAGTFAENGVCGVSATGHGEYFIRYNVAADICARVRYQGLSIGAAAAEVIHKVLLPAGGTGGVIAVSPSGEVAMPFNTSGMYRAAIDGQGRRTIAIYR